MKNRKLYAALLTGTLAVTMMGTTVFAANTGTTQFMYEGGTIQPPGTGDENDWMVRYPTSVKLADSNKAATANESLTSGVPMEFSVTKKDGTTDVTTDNIGNGLNITATAAGWDVTGNVINMDGTNGETVNMQLTSGVTTNQTDFMTDGGIMATLTAGSAATTKATGYASLSSDSAPISGADYSKTVTWTVSKVN